MVGQCFPQFVNQEVMTFRVHGQSGMQTHTPSLCLRTSGLVVFIGWIAFRHHDRHDALCFLVR
jgi:hypothetical protein